MGNEKKLKSNNCLRLMYVKEIIFEYTDEEHFISISEISDMLQSNYGISAARQTLYNDIDLLIEAGYDIECVKGQNNMYHVLSREFENAELHILIDAVESMRSLPPGQSKALIRKLSRQGGPSADYLVQNVTCKGIPKADNNQIYYIIDTIHRAIAQNRQIAFKYYEYLTSSKKVLKNNGNKYYVSPYRLVCSNDFYYLLGYSGMHENIITFRVDRICGIPTITEKTSRTEPTGLSSEKTFRESYHMMEGDESVITLEFKSSVTDAMVDRFGHDLNITYINKDTCIAKVTTQVNNVFFAWIFGFEGKVRIKKPSDVLDKYIWMVSREMARL
ncbi:MAG: transcriptional regulator [Saccharofermentans sp.]|nr:transcriptional regulator [Saccharofermentans sp.]